MVSQKKRVIAVCGKCRANLVIWYTRVHFCRLQFVVKVIINLSNEMPGKNRLILHEFSAHFPLGVTEISQAILHELLIFIVNSLYLSSQPLKNT